MRCHNNYDVDDVLNSIFTTNSLFTTWYFPRTIINVFIFLMKTSLQLSEYDRFLVVLVSVYFSKPPSMKKKYSDYRQKRRYQK